MRIVLSHFQTAPLLAARGASTQHLLASPDLGCSQMEVSLTPGGVLFPGGQLVNWEAIEAIDAAENNCFAVQEGHAEKIVAFSELTGRAYSLYPTPKAPTMLVSGLPMHRIKGTDPQRDTQAKIKTIQPLHGHVLDTATGLGYTAIAAAELCDHVTTIELDPLVLEIARANPWSQALFENPKITQLIGDSFEVILDFGEATFHAIIHDPPVFSLAGHLYSREFYITLFRILKPGGKVFHYIGDPHSRSGRSTTRGVIKRLQEAGFERVIRRPEAFGVLAVKPRRSGQGKSHSN